MFLKVILDFLIHLGFKDVINFLVAIGTISLAFFAYRQIKITKEISEKESIRIDSEINKKRKSVMQKLLLNLRNQKMQIDYFINFVNYLGKEKPNMFGFNNEAYWISSKTDNIYYIYGRWEIDTQFIGDLFDHIEQDDFIKKVDECNSDFIEFEKNLIGIRELFKTWEEKSLENFDYMESIKEHSFKNSDYVKLINDRSCFIIKTATMYLTQSEILINKLEALIKTMDPPQSPPPPQNPLTHSAS